MRLGRGVGDVARNLLPVYLIGKKGERSWIGVAGLSLKPRPIDAPTVQARRSPSLKPLPFETQPPKLVAQEVRRRLAAPAAGELLFTYVGQTIQERPGGHDHGVGREMPPVAQIDATNPSIGDGQLGDLGLNDAEIRLLFQQFPHAQAVLLFVALRARRPDGRARGWY